MVRMLVIAATVVGSLAVTASNTGRGASADVNTDAKCTENTINTPPCK